MPLFFPPPPPPPGLPPLPPPPPLPLPSDVLSGAASVAEQIETQVQAVISQSPPILATNNTVAVQTDSGVSSIAGVVGTQQFNAYVQDTKAKLDQLFARVGRLEIAWVDDSGDGGGGDGDDDLLLLLLLTGGI